MGWAWLVTLSLSLLNRMGEGEKYVEKLVGQDKGILAVEGMGATVYGQLFGHRWKSDKVHSEWATGQYVQMLPFKILQFTFVPEVCFCSAFWWLINKI